MRASSTGQGGRVGAPTRSVRSADFIRKARACSRSPHCSRRDRAHWLRNSGDRTAAAALARHYPCRHWQALPCRPCSPPPRFSRRTRRKARRRWSLRPSARITIKGSFSRSARRTVCLRANEWPGGEARRNSSANKSFTSNRWSRIGRLATAKSISHALASLSPFCCVTKAKDKNRGITRKLSALTSMTQITNYSCRQRTRFSGWRRRLGTALIAVAISVVTHASFAATAEQITARAPVAALNVKDGVAVKGYDPVAYFNDGKPVKGSPEQ